MPRMPAAGTVAPPAAWYIFKYDDGSLLQRHNIKYILAYCRMTGHRVLYLQVQIAHIHPRRNQVKTPLSGEKETKVGGP